VRPDQTAPGTDPLTRPLDRRTPDEPIVATDEELIAMRRHERAGSPSPGEIDRAPSWQEIKSRFVDDPAGAIAAAEDLVRRAVEERIRSLNDEAAALCAPLDDDDTSSTEGLRTRLLRYQEYCERRL
jgi:hypothetical protein